MGGMKQRLIILGISLLVGFSIRYHRKYFGPLPIPSINYSKYWGPGEPRSDDVTIKPFHIEYSDDKIEKLKFDLSRQIEGIAEPLEDAKFQYGFHATKLKSVVQYWENTYLPKFSTERLKYLNKFPHFKTQIQGLNIHFIHVIPENPEGKKVVPLLLLHGWPGSVVEFYEMIPLLTDIGSENVVFEVIVPSLPGYGFSDAASKQGLGQAEAAVIFRNLMLRLGKDKFYVQGGDWGSMVGKVMASFFPENVLGFHSNFLTIRTPLSFVKTFIASWAPTWFVDKEQVDLFFPFGSYFMTLLEESGYFHIQATKPDTIGTVLSHNPVGLAAYILEKFSTWTNFNFRNLEDGGLEKHFSIDHLLDNVMIYYMTNSITSSVRFYKEAFADKLIPNVDRIQTKVPTAVSRFQYDLMRQPDWMLKDKFLNLVESTYHAEGGHFAAKQYPNELFNDVVSFVDKVERISVP